MERQLARRIQYFLADGLFCRGSRRAEGGGDRIFRRLLVILSPVSPECVDCIPTFPGVSLFLLIWRE